MTPIGGAKAENTFTLTQGVQGSDRETPRATDPKVTPRDSPARSVEAADENPNVTQRIADL